MKACLQQPTNVLFQRIYQLLKDVHGRLSLDILWPPHVGCVISLTLASGFQMLVLAHERPPKLLYLGVKR